MAIGTIRTVLLVAGKELRSAVRDRQVVVYSVVLPLVLYPAIFWVMLQGFAYVQGRDRVTEVSVAIGGALGGVPIERVVRELEGKEEADEDAPAPLRTILLGDDLAEDEARRLLLDDEARRAMADPPDAVLRFGRVATEVAEPPISGELPLVRGSDGELSRRPAQLYFDGTRSRSSLAADRVRERLTTLSEELRREAVRERGADPAELTPFAVVETNLATRRDIGGYILSFVLPLTFMAMAALGAFYPAVDATAGEKERKTAETTLLAPTPRWTTLLGKVLAVTCAAVVATALNLLGMGLAAEHLVAQLAGSTGFSIEIPWSSFLAIAPICLIFLFFLSSLLVAVASLANTFKQGQSLLGVMQQFIILPAVVAILPGLQLTVGIAWIPVVQTVLAFKAVLQTDGTEGGAGLLAFVVVGASQLLYAALALWISLRLSSRESLLSEGASLRRVFSLLRSRGSPG